MFLKPSIDQNSYAITTTNNRFEDEIYPNGTRHFVNQEYKPGFRIEALGPISFCPCNIWDARFTSFKSNRSNQVSGPFLFDTVGYTGHGAQAPEDTTYAGTSHMHHYYRYLAADGTVNHPLFNSGCDRLNLLFGLHYAYLKFRLQSTSTGTFDTSDEESLVNNYLFQKSSFWGVGPEIGLDYTLDIPCTRGCVGVNINLRGALLATANNASILYTSERTGPVGVNLRNGSTIVRMNPAINAQIGFGYDYSCSDFQAFFEIGYEFMWYSKAVNKIQSYDIGFAGDTWDYLEDLSLQGPFARININF